MDWSTPPSPSSKSGAQGPTEPLADEAPPRGKKLRLFFFCKTKSVLEFGRSLEGRHRGKRPGPLEIRHAPGRTGRARLVGRLRQRRARKRREGAGQPEASQDVLSHAHGLVSAFSRCSSSRVRNSSFATFPAPR